MPDGGLWRRVTQVLHNNRRVDFPRYLQDCHDSNVCRHLYITPKCLAFRPLLHSYSQISINMQRL